MIFEAKRLVDAKSQHGEGSWWDAQKGVLYWLDCMGAALHITQPGGADRMMRLPFLPMTVIPHQDGGFVFATPDAVVRADEDCTRFRTVAMVCHASADMRFNDGKCDPAGRLYVGSMSTDGQKDAGVLYRVNRNGGVDAVLTGVGISNGIVWHKDTMYYTDTISHQVYAFDYDADTGAISRRRTVFKTSEGMPDGLCMDAAGHVWAALWGASKAVCFDPATGAVLHEVHVPVPQVSSVCFGGEDMTTLFITTSRLELEETQLAAYPASGGLFAARTVIRGAEMFRCAIATGEDRT
jgi:sugar lactone lactonase YvrE